MYADGMIYEAIDEQLRNRGWRKVATGTWLYDRTVTMHAAIWAKPASQASSRYNEDDQLDENMPIPETRDGFLYTCWPFWVGEYLTAEEAKKAADKKPWGPVTWSAMTTENSNNLF
ncbi:MAG TPA: hypothetical protein VEF76_08215 [Patescibacteria group bacterium]|nr:hypothetical protein [Patescibacteria group bacterium]